MRNPDLDPETDDSSEEPAALTRDAVTPRGGFMARPGLKAPPRHAVVIRGGDVEPSEDLPIARGSHPPPPPATEPPPDSSIENENEKATLRAIPTPRAETPRSELPTQLDLSPPRPMAAPVESLPPPSDMPVVASVRAPDYELAQARQRARSRWTIASAAAAGLLFGVASIAATRWEQAAAPRPAGAQGAPLGVAAPLAPAVPATAPQAVSAVSAVSALPSSSARELIKSAAPASGQPAVPAAQPPAPAERSSRASSKRSIF